ncbi:trichoplein keratin filament-binding protein isoform X1 [Bemisia tabaci]|nr:PREDICTED: trichoplein keratin filament-binding protein-like isoform X1 [Bemisia tabaci]
MRRSNGKMNSGRYSARREEELIVRKRNAESLHREHWNHVTKYFQVWDVRASKFSAWTSPEYYNSSFQGYEKRVENEKKKQKLIERREKLAAFLHAEEKEYNEELKRSRRTRSGSGSVLKTMPLEELKNLNVEMKMKEEESRKREAELKNYLVWKSNQPVLRDFHRQQQEKFVKQCWVDQIKEKQEEKRREEEFNKQLEKKEAELKMEEEERAKEALKKKQAEAAALKQQLLHQIELLKEKERRTEELKEQERRELALRKQLEDINVHRELIELHRKKKEHSQFLTRQYEVKLKRQTMEVQEELAEDKKILDRISKALLEEQELDAARKEEIKKEMIRVNSLLKEMNELEKKREKQLDFIFYEEAKRLWEQQEKQWKQEKAAREKLMKEVIGTLEKQISDKLKQNLDAQKELIEERESLLSSVESMNDEIKKHETALESSRTNWKNNLQAQIAEKTRLEEESRKKEEEEISRLRKAETDEENRLASELSKMRFTPFSSRTSSANRRTRFIW